MARTQQTTVRSLVAWAESVERATPYYAWRDAFSRLLHLDAADDRERARERVLQCLRTQERRSRAALINVVCPLDFQESAESRALSPAVRARSTRELLVEMFRTATRGEPTMLVLEDVDVDVASSAAVWGAFVNAGQACLSVERCYVHHSLYESFAAACAARRASSS